MPSSLVSSRDGPVVKRQKLNGADAPRGTQRESKIFTPFRVCAPGFHGKPNMLIYLDNRLSILDFSSFHHHTPRENNLPNHHLRWRMSANLRSQARPQPRLLNSTTDTRRYHCNGSMEGLHIRSMGRGVLSRSLGIQAGEGYCRIGYARRPPTTD